MCAFFLSIHFMSLGPPQPSVEEARHLASGSFLVRENLVYFHKIPLSKWFLKTILLGRWKIDLIMDEKTSLKLNNCYLSTVMVELGLEPNVDCTLLQLSKSVKFLNSHLYSRGSCQRKPT